MITSSDSLEPDVKAIIYSNIAVYAAPIDGSRTCDEETTTLYDSSDDSILTECLIEPNDDDKYLDIIFCITCTVL